MKYKGNHVGEVDVCHGDDVSELETVDGNLIVSTEMNFPALIAVEGNLLIYQNASFPALALVGRDVDCPSPGSDFPTLEAVGKFTHVHPNVMMPALKTLGGLQLLPEIESLANLKIVSQLALQEGALNMGVVHDKCETAHCIAGWACAAIPGGRELEKSHDWDIAAAHLLGFEAAKMFYASEEEARTFLEKIGRTEIGK